MSLPRLLHHVVIFALLVIFLLFFGVPSLKTFLRRGLFTDIEEMGEASLALPAVTFCVKNPKNKNTAWKKENLRVESNDTNNDRDAFLSNTHISEDDTTLKIHGNTLGNTVDNETITEEDKFEKSEADSVLNAEEVSNSKESALEVNHIPLKCGPMFMLSPSSLYSCVKQKTYNLSESLLTARLGVTRNSQDILDPDFWNSDMTVSEHGFCHTFDYPIKLGADPFEEVVTFILDKKLEYKVRVHDPNFFLVTANPIAIPQIPMELRSSDNPRTSMNFLKAIKHHKMNTKDNPCEEDKDYSFTLCVKESLTRKVGCRLEWSLVVDNSMPLCENLTQIMKFEYLYFNLTMLQQSSVVATTGCSLPCTYMEYTLAGAPYSQGNKFGLGRLCWLCMGTLYYV